MEALSELLPRLQTRCAEERLEQSRAISRVIRDWVARNSDYTKIVPIVQRLARESPFKDLRSAFTQLENEICPNASPPLPVSRFLPAESIPDISAMSEGPLFDFYQDFFLAQGRISHLDQVISIQPKFALSYFSSYLCIMSHDGPLPVCYRNFLGIMAAARLQCDYLLKLQQREFTLNGGPDEWLTDQGAHLVPDKLNSFQLLNAFMCHQPWRIDRETLSALLSGSDLNISELMHGIIVLSTFQALCGLCFGLGVVGEVDLDYCPEPPIEGPTSTSSKTGNDATHHLTVLLQTSLEELLAKHSEFDPFSNADELAEPHSSQSWQKDHVVSPASPMTPRPTYERFLGDVVPDLQYEDYDVKSKVYKVFHMDDFDWKGHGYSLVSRYWHDRGAQLLDEEFDLIYNLTDHSVSDATREIDTGPFRRAIWHYVFRLFGVSNDSYNYQEVNIFLNRSIKLYIKRCACAAHNVTHADFANLGYSLRPDEVVHVALLVFEARRQATLLYALRALRQISSSTM